MKSILRILSTVGFIGVIIFLIPFLIFLLGIIITIPWSLLLLGSLKLIFSLLIPNLLFFIFIFVFFVIGYYCEYQLNITLRKTLQLSIIIVFYAYLGIIAIIVNNSYPELESISRNIGSFYENPTNSYVSFVGPILIIDAIISTILGNLLSKISKYLYNLHLFRSTKKNDSISVPMEEKLENNPNKVNQ